HNAHHLREPGRSAVDGWRERRVTGDLRDGWMDTLAARMISPGAESHGLAKAEAPAVNAEAGPPTGAVKVGGGREAKPGSSPAVHLLATVAQHAIGRGSEDEPIAIPSVIEGAIKRPGDINTFKFKSDSRQKLAFEIETPDAQPPHFNPRLGIIDSHGHELVANVERRLSMFNANSAPEVYLRGIASKMLYTFEEAGTYVLQVRDITSRYGDASYRYRVLVRPQMPHVGEVTAIEGDPPNPIFGDA